MSRDPRPPRDDDDDDDDDDDGADDAAAPAAGQPEDDRPWTEAQWEKFMKESDARSARYGELLETFMDHPQRDVVVAREMGWDGLADACEAEARGELPGADEDEADEAWSSPPDAKPDDAPADKRADASEGDDEDEDDDIEGENDADWYDDGRGSVTEIPAYRLAFKVGMEIHRALRPFVTGRDPERDRTPREEDEDELFGRASIGVHIAAAKLSGGHAMGYDDDVLCGHIVNCRRGLEGAEQAEAALIGLRDTGALPPDVVETLLPRVREVIEAMKARIAELRSKVWW
jgi:hypothetical protein